MNSIILETWMNSYQVRVAKERASRITDYDVVSLTVSYRSHPVTPKLVSEVCIVVKFDQL